MRWTADTDRDIPPALLAAAQQAGGHKTKKAAVIAILEEYFRRRAIPRVARLFGEVDYDPAYDHKDERRRPPDPAMLELPRPTRPAAMTNVIVDEALVAEVQELSGVGDPTQAVVVAMKEYIAMKKRLQIFELEGKIDYDPDCDYKGARSRT